MPFIFGAAVEDAYFLGEKDGDLSQEIMGYWTRFARTGNPNTTRGFTWPLFTESTEKYLNLNDNMEVQANLREEYCSFWDAR